MINLLIYSNHQMIQILPSIIIFPIHSLSQIPTKPIHSFTLKRVTSVPVAFLQSGNRPWPPPLIPALSRPLPTLLVRTLSSSQRIIRPESHSLPINLTTALRLSNCSLKSSRCPMKSTESFLSCRYLITDIYLFFAFEIFFWELGF